MFNKRKFMAQLALNGMTQRDLARELGINESTLYRKIIADGDFSRKEINMIVEILKIEDPVPIFFDSELTETQAGTAS